MPVGAFAGRKEIMQHIAPLGSVYQAGTLSGNPLAMIAGYTLLNELNINQVVYNELEAKGAYLQKGLTEVLKTKARPFRINRMGSMISVHFSDQEIVDFKSASASNIEIFNKFFHHMLNSGVYLPPSAFETWFISNAITYQDLDRTIDAASRF